LGLGFRSCGVGLEVELKYDGMFCFAADGVFVGAIGLEDDEEMEGWRYRGDVAVSVMACVRCAVWV